MNRRQTTFATAMLVAVMMAASCGQALGQAAGSVGTAWTQRGGEGSDPFGIYERSSR